jgi:Polyketide cyclase / dehydrase and lipid transport
LGRIWSGFKDPLGTEILEIYVTSTAAADSERLSMPRGILITGLLIAFAAEMPLAEEPFKANEPQNEWKAATNSGELAIFTRTRNGSKLQEFKAVGEIDASSRAVHAVIDDLERYVSFMPYMAECRLVKREGDSSLVTYQRLSPKICQDRDYTLRVCKKSWPATDGLVYSNRWEPANELGPAEKKGVVRVKVCEGSWLLEPVGATKTRATYSLYTDTGGTIPVFISNRVNQMGIGRIFAAVRKQVKDPKYDAADR